MQLAHSWRKCLPVKAFWYLFWIFIKIKLNHYYWKTSSRRGLNHLVSTARMLGESSIFESRATNGDSVSHIASRDFNFQIWCRYRQYRDLFYRDSEIAIYPIFVKSFCSSCVENVDTWQVYLCLSVAGSTVLEWFYVITYCMGVVPRLYTVSCTGHMAIVDFILKWFVVARGKSSTLCRWRWQISSWWGCSHWAICLINW